MPWWLILYLAVFAGITALWVRDDIRDKEPIAYLVAELVATGLLVVSGMAYWSGLVRAVLGTSDAWVFAGSLSWILLASYRELRRPDPELSPRAALAVRVGSLALLLAVYSPLFFWGFVSAFRGSHNAA